MNKLNSDLNKAYCSIANSYPSSWDHPVSDTWLRVNALPPCLTPSSKAKPFEPDFLHSNPRYADYEARWWDSTIASTKFRTADPSMLAAWDAIAPFAINRRDVSPRTARYVENLTLAARDANAYNEATSTLHSLPNYSKLVNTINDLDMTEAAMKAI
jgi:hypothetical protein